MVCRREIVKPPVIWLSIRRGRASSAEGRKKGAGVKTGVAWAAVSGAITSVVLVLGSSAFAQVAQFDVPSEDAGKSIPELARQAGIQVIAPGEQLHGVVTPALKGRYDVIVALNLMLNGTGLIVSRSADGIMTISLPEPRVQEEREGMLKEQKTAVSVLALLVTGALSGFPASAQSGDAGQIETVTVTGQRAAIQSAIQLKAKAEVIVDSISAEDVGKLPDNSVTEVLSRMAGVNITRIQTGGQSENYVGEGTGIQIRGLDSVVSQLNGRDSFSSANGRNLAWEDVPPELMQGVDVYKSLSANLPEGGFGGVINLRTRQPFDYDGFSASATLTGNYADYSSLGHLGGNALISDRWKTKIGDIGLLLNVAYSDLATKADGVQVSPYVPVVAAGSGYNTSNGLPYVSSYNLDSDSTTPVPCTGQPAVSCQEVYVPQAINYTERNDDRVRTGYYAALEWNPSERLSLFVTGFRSRYNENTLSRTISNTTSGFVALDPTSNSTFDKYGNLLSTDKGLTSYSYQDPGAAAYFGVNSGWAYQKVPYQFDSTLNHTVNQTTDVSVGGEWNPTDNFGVKFAAQHVDSFSNTTQKGVDLYAFVGGYGVTLSPYGDATPPVLDFPAIDLTQKNRYGWNNTQDHLTANSGQENAFYADGSWTVSDTAFFRSVKFGVKVTDRVESDWETTYNWHALTPSYQSGWVETDSVGNVLTNSSNNPIECFQGASMPSGTLCQTKNVAAISAVKTAANTNPAFVSLVDTGDWFEGKAGLPARAWFPSLDVLHQNFTTLHSYTNGLGAPGDVATAGAFAPQDLGQVKEMSFSGYAQANFAWERWRMPISGNIGLRVVAYKDKSTGYFANPYYTSPIYLQPPAATYSECDTADTILANHCIATGGYVPNTIGFTAPKSYVPNSGSHSEVDALPSLNVQIIPLPDNLPGLKVRFAASQGISRPNFQQLTAKGSYSGTYVGNYQAYFGGNVGNPNLKPERAEQFDASVEYYFETGGQAHFSPFYKQIHNYIADGTSQITEMLQTVVAGGSVGQGNQGCATPIVAGESCPQQVSVTMVEPLNEKQVALVRGFEVGLQKYATFLPDPYNGFGVDLNYTFISSSQPGALAYDLKGNLITGLPAVGLSKNTINAALLYDNKPLSIRIAYNWRDSFLVTAAAYQTTYTYNYILNLPSGAGTMPQGNLGPNANGVVHSSLPVFQYPSGQLDASLTYDLTDNIQWSVQASNLTKEVARLFMGVGNHRENRSWYTADTRYTSQLSVKF